MVRIPGLALTMVVLMLTPALAHTGIGDASGFAHGLTHPIRGLDHVLTMIAVGVYAAMLGGRALWLVPTSFLAMMGVGGAFGMAGLDIPLVELAIGLSVVALGVAVATHLDTHIVATVAFVGFLAIFHGYAHGAEMPDTASGLEYGLGFVLATASLHLSGIGLGWLIAKAGETRSRRLGRIAGGAMAICGMAILGHLI